MSSTENVIIFNNTVHQIHEQRHILIHTGAIMNVAIHVFGLSLSGTDCSVIMFEWFLLSSYIKGHIGRVDVATFNKCFTSNNCHQTRTTVCSVQIKS